MKERGLRRSEEAIEKERAWWSIGLIDWTARRCPYDWVPWFSLWRRPVSSCHTKFIFKFEIIIQKLPGGNNFAVIRQLCQLVTESLKVSNACWCMHEADRSIPWHPWKHPEDSKKISVLGLYTIVLASLSTGRQVVRYVCELLLLLHAGLTMTRVTKRISLDRRCGSRAPTDNAKIFSSWYGVEK